MIAITEDKSYSEIQDMLDDRGDLPVVVIGCGQCVGGGPAQARERYDEVLRWVRAGAFYMEAPDGLSGVADPGLCDPVAGVALLKALRDLEEDVQLLVLACGAGLDRVQSILPGVRLVPALDTLGLGVGGQLSCVACGECHFGQQGCRMIPVLGRQAARLTHTRRGAP